MNRVRRAFPHICGPPCALWRTRGASILVNQALKIQCDEGPRRKRLTASQLELFGQFNAGTEHRKYLLCYRGGSVTFLLEPEERPGQCSDDRQTQIAAVNSLAQRQIVDQANEYLLIFVA